MRRKIFVRRHTRTLANGQITPVRRHSRQIIMRSPRLPSIHKLGKLESKLNSLKKEEEKLRNEQLGIEKDIETHNALFPDRVAKPTEDDLWKKELLFQFIEDSAIDVPLNIDELKERNYQALEKLKKHTQEMIQHNIVEQRRVEEAIRKQKEHAPFSFPEKYDYCVSSDEFVDRFIPPSDRLTKDEARQLNKIKNQEERINKKWERGWLSPTEYTTQITSIQNKIDKFYEKKKIDRKSGLFDEEGRLIDSS